MANIKISELPALTPPDAADLVPVTDSSASQTKRTTVGEIVGIVNGDVAVANDGTATISELPVSKLADGTARQLLQTDAAGTGVEWTSNVDVPGTLDVTGAAVFDNTGRFTGDVTLDSTLIFEGSTADGFETTLTVVDPTADRTITLPDVTGTVITTGDTGTVTSTMILDGTIVDGDINASAAIAGTKIDPDFGSQTIETTGVINAGSGTEAAPAVTVGTTGNGLYSPGTDQVAISNNGTERLFIDANGNVGVNTNPSKGRLHISDGSSGQSSPNSFANTLIVEDNASNGISILTPSTEIGSIFFGDESDNFIGGIRYNHTDDSFQLYANNNERLRITSDAYVRLASGTGGIQFNGDTAAANALDDYEEGTFTLAVADAVTGGNTGTSSTCIYTKIGRIVTARGKLFTIDTTGLTAGNTVYFQGLPFAPATYNAVGSITIEAITFSGFVTAQCSPSATAFRLAESTSGSGENYLLVSDLTSGSAGIVAFEITYTTT